jgi:hypothetical protein
MITRMNLLQGALAILLLAGIARPSLSQGPPPPPPPYSSGAPGYPPVPAPQMERPPPPPPQAYMAWRPGHWEWSNRLGQYRWIPGRYVQAPHPGAIWANGEWVFRQGAWRRRNGHWR